MKTKTKRIGMALALAIAFAVAAGLLWKKHSPPQIITLPNGEQFEFVAAEWGTNQVQPTAAARFFARLPAPVAGYVYQKWGDRLGIVTPIDDRQYYVVMSGGSLKLAEPSLHLWFRSLSTNTAGISNDFRFMLADRNGVVATGRGYDVWSSYGQGTSKWLTTDFPVVPRRSETLQLLLFKADDQRRGPFHQIGAVRFRNPLYGHFPQWQPESLPVTKTNGDLSVRLTDFTVGGRNWGGNDIVEVGGRQTRFHSPEPGEFHRIVFKLDIHSPRGTNEGWSIQPAEVSDATGNHIQNSSCSLESVTGEYCLGGDLWPDESAWRLKLTLRKQRGYAAEEVMAFTNVPVPVVGATNIVFQTNVIHGLPVVLKQEFTRAPDGTPIVFGGLGDVALRPTTHVVAELVNQPEGYVVDSMELRADTGWIPKERLNRLETNSATVFLKSIPADVRTLDIAWAVQKTRTVEFYVKPPKLE